MPALIVIGWLLDRMKEPSTHAGLAGAAAALAGLFPAEYQPLVQAGAAFLGAVAVFLKEKGAA